MKLVIEVSLGFRADTPIECLLQCEVAPTSQQQISSGVTTLPKSLSATRVTAQDDVGERFWIKALGDIAITYEAAVDIVRGAVALEALAEVPKTALPADATQYLFDSHYCAGEAFQSFVEDEFGPLSGGARIAAMRDWIGEHFTYSPGASGPATTARDSFIARRGVCRDYAHVMVAFARASGIPARYASCYAPDVTPQDFHAVAEIYLGGEWVLVDATGMAKPDETAVIGVGRDAADVSFLTSFGAVEFGGHEVIVERVAKV